MKKKWTTMFIATAMLSSTVVGFTACGKTSDAMNARDVYALSAVSSISYLSTKTPDSATATLMATTATVRPATVTDEDMQGIQNCLDMFDGIIVGGGVEQTIQNNTSDNALLSDYTFEMTITLSGLTGEIGTYTMYFDEIKKSTNTEIEDGQEEIEEDTVFAGVVVYSEEFFVVEGVREVEVEGKEVEDSIEFKTYKNIGDTTIVKDTNNYVIVEKSVENNEMEYEYTFFKNGIKVQDFELEYEEGKKGTEVSFQLKDVSTGIRQETEYTIRKGKTSEKFVITFEKNGAKDTIQVVKNASGYTFTFSNGYVENV